MQCIANLCWVSAGCAIDRFSRDASLMRAVGRILLSGDARIEIDDFKWLVATDAFDLADDETCQAIYDVWFINCHKCIRRLHRHLLVYLWQLCVGNVTGLFQHYIDSWPTKGALYWSSWGGRQPGWMASYVPHYSGGIQLKWSHRKSFIKVIVAPDWKLSIGAAILL